MILFALLIIIGILAILWKLPQKKLFGLNIWFDVAIIAFLTVFLHGTALGMITGLVAGAGISVYLLVGRWFTSYQKLRISRAGIQWEPVEAPVTRMFRKLRNTFRRYTPNTP